MPTSPRVRIAALAATAVLTVAGIVHAQFAAPTCVPPNCNPAVIQNVALSSAAQVASINITGDGGIGAKLEAGRQTPTFTAATDYLYYGNVNAASTAGYLLALQLGGADRYKVSIAGQQQVPLGSVGAPSYSFIGDTNTGIYSQGADILSFASGGVSRLVMNSGGIYVSNGQFTMNTAGTAATPAYSFNTDTNTGIYRSAADTINIATNGISRFQIDSAGAVTIPGNLTVSGTFSSTGGLSGDGSALTNLNASNVSSGTLNDARLSTNVATYSGGGTFTGANTFSNASNSFTGSGAGLTSLNASNISSGTLADARLSSNVPLLNATQTFTGANTFSNASNSFTGSGAGLTSLNASNISSGTLADGRLSSNVALYNANGTFTGNNTFSGMTSYGSAALPVIGAQNLIYGNVDTTSTGALVLLQNESVDRFRVAANGDVTATSFSGVGTNLTALNATNLTSGTVASARISGTYSNALVFSGANTYSNRSTFGSAALVVAGGQSLLYGNVDTTSAGNLLQLQNESVDRFRVDANGNTTIGGNLNVTGIITGTFTETDTLQTVVDRGRDTTTTISVGVGAGPALDSTGVSARATAFGLYGVGTDAATGYGVYGNGGLAGVRGDSGATGYGVYGFANTGVYGYSSSAAGYGGYFVSGGGGTGLYASGATYAVNASGNVNVTGTGTFGGNVTVAGQSVCRANGTNCPADAVTSVTGSGVITASPTTGAVTVSLNDDSLDFDKFQDALDLDANTTWDFGPGASNYTLTKSAPDNIYTMEVVNTAQSTGNGIQFNSSTYTTGSAIVINNSSAGWPTASRPTTGSLFKINNTGVWRGDFITLTMANTSVSADPVAIFVDYDNGDQIQDVFYVTSDETTTSAEGADQIKFRVRSNGSIETPYGMYISESGSFTEIRDRRFETNNASGLSFNTTYNMPITTGTGLVTLGGNLQVNGSSLTVAGIQVCRANGTNCPASAVTSVTGSGAGITVSPTTGAVVVSNTGVTSAVAGTGIGVSGATGAVTFTNTGDTNAADDITGSGTVNTIPKFTAGTTLGNSLVTDNGATVTAGGNISVTGNATFGDAAADTLTVNGTAVSVPNNLNVDANTLFIDAVNNRVGLGTSTPNFPLSLGSTTANTKLALYETSSVNAYGLGVIPGAFVSHLNGSGARFGFFDSPTLTTELLTIQGTGNVGIANISPSYKIDVTGTARVTGELGVAGYAPTAGWGITTGGSSYGMVAYGGSYGVYASGSTYALYGAGDGYISGETGIGTGSTADYQLSVYNDSTAYAYIARKDGGINGKGIMAYGQYYGGYFNDTDGTAYGYAAWGGYGYYGLGTTSGGYFANTSGGGVTYIGGYSGGGYGVYVGSGNTYGVVGYGVSTGARFYDSDGTATTFIAGASWGVEIITGGAVKPGGGSWSAPSDARTKKDVSDFTDGLAVIRRLNPVNYTYNGLGETPKGMKGIGFIAQEAEPVAPYLVQHQQKKLHPDDIDTTDMLVVDPSAVSFINMNAIKELDIKIVGLEAKVEKIDELDAKVKTLEERVQRLESELEEVKSSR